MTGPVLSHADLTAAGYVPAPAAAQGLPPLFTVTLDTPAGPAVLEVPTFQGPAAAGRRAHLTAVHLGWGDLDEITVQQVERVPPVMPDAVTFWGPLA